MQVFKNVIVNKHVKILKALSILIQTLQEINFFINLKAAIIQITQAIQTLSILYFILSLSAKHSHDKPTKLWLLVSGTLYTKPDKNAKQIE